MKKSLRGLYLKFKHRLGGNRGFTLIEVIVVLVILAILMAMAVPNVLGYIQKAKSVEIESTARNIYMAAVTESAELSAVKGELSAEDFSSENLANIESLANMEAGSISAAASVSSAPAEGKAVIAVVDGAVAYVTYTGENGGKTLTVCCDGTTGNVMPNYYNPVSQIN